MVSLFFFTEMKSLIRLENWLLKEMLKWFRLSFMLEVLSRLGWVTG